MSAWVAVSIHFPFLKPYWASVKILFLLKKDISLLYITLSNNFAKTDMMDMGQIQCSKYNVAFVLLGKYERYCVSVTNCSVPYNTYDLSIAVFGRPCMVYFSRIYLVYVCFIPRQVNVPSQQHMNWWSLHAWHSLLGQIGYPQHIWSTGHSYRKIEEARGIFNIRRREKRWKFLKITLLTYLLTYSMEQSPSWEANWFCS